MARRRVLLFASVRARRPSRHSSTNNNTSIDSSIHRSPTRSLHSLPRRARSYSLVTPPLVSLPKRARLPMTGVAGRASGIPSWLLASLLVGGAGATYAYVLKSIGPNLNDQLEAEAARQEALERQRK